MILSISQQQEIIDAYRSNESLSQIAVRLSLSVPFLKRVLLANDVEIRTKSEAYSLRASQFPTDLDQLSKAREKAHATIRSDPEWGVKSAEALKKARAARLRGINTRRLKQGLPLL